jgi:hypothetical protein
MPELTLWEPGTTLHTVTDIKPQLASWDRQTHPSQIRLQSYLLPVMDALLPRLSQEGEFFLHLDVDVERPAHLLRHHDLENYLTPLFGMKRLDASRFPLVTARKYVGGGSRLVVGTARHTADSVLFQNWAHFSYTAHGSVQTKQWKEKLRNALAATKPTPLTAPAVEVQIAWTCSPRRNWVSLWKPTGDCMGPILGEQNPLRPFAPDDDRIVELQFHRMLDESLGNDVHIDIWWRAAELG